MIVLYLIGVLKVSVGHLRKTYTHINVLPHEGNILLYMYMVLVFKCNTAIQYNLELCIFTEQRRLL